VLVALLPSSGIPLLVLVVGVLPSVGSVSRRRCQRPAQGDRVQGRQAPSLYNRRFLLLRFEEEVGRWHQLRRPCSLVLLEPEGLRVVADTAGYAAHDEANTGFRTDLDHALRHSLPAD
jgi:hypothetical protein